METIDAQVPAQSGQQARGGIVARLAGVARRVLPGPYHVLRMTRHKVRVRQLKRVLRVIAPKDGVVVQNGPFKGMIYVQSVIDSALAVPRALGSALAPKLLGCYEAELHDALASALHIPYADVIDIGSAEGYYAVGLALRLPSTRVRAFEMDALRQQLCAEMAQANGVADRVIIDGACTPEKLTALLTGGRQFILCDCEGYELELLQPDRIPGLKGCDLLVELHDSANPAISSTIMARFAPTHEITLIQSSESDPTAYPVLASLSAKDQRFAVGEERPEGMQWVFLQASNGQPATGASR